MISVYCSETLDGLVGAAIVLRHAMMMKLPSVFGGFLHPSDLSSELDDLASEEGGLLFVVDVCVLPEHVSQIERLMKKNKLVYWNSPDEKSVVVPSRIFDGFRENKCASELAFERFLPHDAVARELAIMAHQVKFWKLNDERAMKLSALLSAGFDPFELLKSLSKGIFWKDSFEKFYVDFEKKKLECFEEMMRSLLIRMYVSVRFGFVICPLILSSADACQKVLDSHAGVDVAVVFFRDSKIAFRKRDGVDVDLSLVAQLFGGGGKHFASGAKVPFVVTKDSYESVVFYIDQALRNYFLKV